MYSWFFLIVSLTECDDAEPIVYNLLNVVVCLPYKFTLDERPMSIKSFFYKQNLSILFFLFHSYNMDFLKQFSFIFSSPVFNVIMKIRSEKLSSFIVLYIFKIFLQLSIIILHRKDNKNSLQIVKNVKQRHPNSIRTPEKVKKTEWCCVLASFFFLFITK